jgi:CdiI immunity protein
MSYYDSHQLLFHVFGGYLNQSFHHIYVWEDKKPQYEPLIRKYKTEDTQEGIDKTIAQLKDIMIIGKGSDEEGWGNILDDLSLGYYPPGDNLTYEEWLEDVLKILEEPMEETLRHWIPERI